MDLGQVENMLQEGFSPKVVAEKMIREGFDFTQEDFYGEDDRKVHLIAHLACLVPNVDVARQMASLILTLFNGAALVLGGDYDASRFCEEETPFRPTEICNVIPQIEMFSGWVARHLFDHIEEVRKHYLVSQDPFVAFFETLVNTHQGILPGTFLMSRGGKISLCQGEKRRKAAGLCGNTFFKDLLPQVKVPGGAEKEDIRRVIGSLKEYTLTIQPDIQRGGRRIHLEVETV